MLAAEDFLRPWRLERRLDDRLAGRTGRLEGVLRVLAEPDGLRLEEEGWLHWGDGPPLPARAAWLWRWEGGEVAVAFADGRAFHRFRPAGLVRGTEHCCGADLYRVRYDFRAWPVWRTEWTAHGPRKDYRLESVHRPA
ncbi:DUF6314 family protein [Rubellimicrobium sp. CFH 75288]|uniref:DUF6314 family protein n=1 Tax=Rubellimicrobium sp. CFH 75288 TaxID=2697034 RepID=UPI0014123FA6|nr:DUF6314 family protein [Rubellimicrobium sp. CFH 75288]NAZ35551.1 hypothetical protein [Rubellimicrobium sp. CFH 75288]